MNTTSTVKKATRGFTLVQLLIVIAFMTAIIAMSFSFFQTRAEQIKLEKTAFQVQAILEAGMAYHLIKAVWPTTFEDLLDNNFLPTLPAEQGGNNNPFGNVYTLSAPEGLNGDNLVLTTDVNSSTLASILAGRLPNASVSGSSVSVTLNLYATPPEDPIILEIIEASMPKNPSCYFYKDSGTGAVSLGAAFDSVTNIPCQCLGEYQTKAKAQCNAMGKTADYAVGFKAWDGGFTSVLGVNVGNIFFDAKISKAMCSTASGGIGTTWGIVAAASNELVDPVFSGTALVMIYCR